MTRDQAEQIARRVMSVMLRSMISRGEAARLCVEAIMEAVAVEREECARVCENLRSNWNCCADAIRARGNE